MSMNMSHLTMNKRSNKPDVTIPTYGVLSASFTMTGGIPRGGVKSPLPLLFLNTTASGSLFLSLPL